MFSKILCELIELMCLNMTNPLEIKMKLDENGDIISAHKSNDSFNQYIQETKQNVLIYLSMIEN